MNPNIQIKRLEKQMHKILLSTLSENVDDPIFQTVSFTFVKLTNDKSQLTVYVDVLDRNNIDLVLQKLEKTKGLFRSILAQKLTIYKAPSIKFINDKVLDAAERIEQLINEVKTKPNKN